MPQIVPSLALLAGVANAAAFGQSPMMKSWNWLRSSHSQAPLGPASSAAVSASALQCHLPPALDPGADGLPAADVFFTSDEALAQQVKRHQAIVRVPSICYDDLGDFDKDDRWAPFYDLHDALLKTYPAIHKSAKVEKINRFGLVYTFEGSDSSLKPMLLAAHQDVVPVADESTWTHPPFDAVYDGEYLWGRGSSDDKNSMTALMSAIETLLTQTTWAPRRSLILAFGFDEECSGYRGAGSIGKHLTERYGDNGIALVLDEGGDGSIDMGDGVLYVLPAVMEKGHVDIWYELDVVGGHSSIPFPHTGIGIMAEIVSALEANPYEPEVLKGSPVYNHLQCMARFSGDHFPHLEGKLKNDDMDGLADAVTQLSRPAAFLIQTSQAVDYIAGGQKINAMPEVTTLGVNYRVAPQDSIPKVQHNSVKYIKDIVAKYNLTLKAFEGDEDYENYAAQTMGDIGGPPAGDIDYEGTLIITTKEKSESTPVAPTTGPVWDVFSGTIQHSFASGDEKIVPVGQIMTGNTDTRHYLNLTPHVYRFTPNRGMSTENAHTIDERVRMDAHMTMVSFYYEFVRNVDAADF